MVYGLAGEGGYDDRLTVEFPDVVPFPLDEAGYPLQVSFACCGLAVEPIAEFGSAGDFGLRRADGAGVVLAVPGDARNEVDGDFGGFAVGNGDRAVLYLDLVVIDRVGQQTVVNVFDMAAVVLVNIVHEHQEVSVDFGVGQGRANGSPQSEGALFFDGLEGFQAGFFFRVPSQGLFQSIMVLVELVDPGLIEVDLVSKEFSDVLFVVSHCRLR